MDGPEALASLVDVSHETLDRLQRFEALLCRWQRKTNLVGTDTLNAFWTHHVGDAAFLHAAAPEVRDWTDIGSGAGLPGLVLAILAADRPEPGRFALVESNAKKCAFQRAAILELGLREQVEIAIHNRRIEAYRTSDATVLTARALAALDRLIDHMVQLGVQRGLFLKGENHAAEIAAARNKHRFSVETLPHPLRPGSVLLDIRV